MAQRMIWSCTVLGIFLVLTGRTGEIRAAFRNKALIRAIALSAFLLTCNWTLFLWAVNSGRVVESSLGYFMTPLFNVLSGRIFFGERISRLQGLAILIATSGVLVGVVAYGTVPWLGLALAVSFASYGFMHKTVRVDAAPGLFLETLCVVPFAIVWLLSTTNDFGGLIGNGFGHVLLIWCCVLFTALPLTLFSYAAHNVPLATLGILQYFSPSLNFILAITVMGEHIKPSDYLTFPLIWVALVLYSWDTVRTLRAYRKTGRAHVE